METNLFGDEVKEETGKRKTVPNGYASKPGSGPEGETCKTCRFAVGRQYKKCLLAKSSWTHGTASDIRLKSPACHLWKRKEN